MLKKGNKTKQFIIAESKKLFAQQGYATVTMQDVCATCNLSRGGLYRYFGSTKEIFLEILNEDEEDKGELLLQYMNENISALQILKWFFEDRKETLMLGDYQGFSLAVHEFTKQEIEQRKHLKERLGQAQQSLRLLFEYGQRQGEFKIFDNESMALTVLLFLDSLEINAAILGFTDEDIDRQLDLLLDAIKN